MDRTHSDKLVFLTTDINEFACETTRQTGLHNGITQIEPIRTSLVNGIMPRLKNRIDILCFNPPYVVTTHEEVGSLGIEASWAGGIDGREVIDQLLPLVKVCAVHGTIGRIDWQALNRTFFLLLAYFTSYWSTKTSLTKWFSSWRSLTEWMQRSSWNVVLVEKSSLL